MQHRNENQHLLGEQSDLAGKSVGNSKFNHHRPRPIRFKHSFPQVYFILYFPSVLHIILSGTKCIPTTRYNTNKIILCWAAELWEYASHWKS